MKLLLCNCLHAHITSTLYGPDSAHYTLFSNPTSAACVTPTQNDK